MATAKVRPLGNRHSMSIGSLVFKIKRGEGEVKLAPEFFLLPEEMQRDLLLDWISQLEALYDSKVTDPKSFHRRISKPSPFEQPNDNTTN